MKLEFGAKRSFGGRLAYGSLGLVAVLFFVSALYYGNQLRSVTALQGAVRMSAFATSRAPRSSAIESRQEETAKARLSAAKLVLDRLNVPWSKLFVALEESATREVAILRVEPDIGHHEVRVTLQTSKIAKAVAYAKGLQSNDAFVNVYIATQRASPADPIRPLQVDVVAQWSIVKKAAAPQSGESPLRAAASRTHD